MANTAHALFQAMRPKSRKGPALPIDLPKAPKPREDRDPLDFDPTPHEVTQALLAVEGARIKELGSTIWEPAVGAGHIAVILKDFGFRVIGSDIVDRNWPGTVVRSFYDYSTAPADIVFTNPPYNEINARDGHGRWFAPCHAVQSRICRPSVKLGLAGSSHKRAGRTAPALSRIPDLPVLLEDRFPGRWPTAAAQCLVHLGPRLDR